MKKYFVCGLLPFLILFGLSYGLIKAADVEIILGTSSAFNVVRGTDVSSGTKMLYVGSSTVSIGTTTQSAMLTIAGSSTDTTGGLRVTNSSGTVTLNVRNDGAVFIGTNTSSLNSALYVGSATSGSLGTITAGFLSMGTISANAGLHGTTTVRFLSDIFANGTVTASKFSGDGAGLTGVTATTFSGGGTINAGSTTVSTLTSTGSTTVTGTLTAGGGNFAVDTSLNRAVIDFNTVGIGTNTPSSSYMLQVTDSSDLGVVVGSSGSMTAKTLSITGSATVTGTLTAGGGNFVVDNSINRAVIDFNTVGIGTNTPSSSYMLQVTDSSDLGVVVGSSGSITAKTITSTGSITVSSNGTITAGFLSVGTVSASASGHGTTTVRFLDDIYSAGTVTAAFFKGNGSSLTGITATSGVTGGNISTSGTISAGSTTVSTLTSTGSTTVTGTLTAGGGNFVIDNNANRAVIDFNTVGIGTNTPSSSYMLQVTDSSDLGVVIGSSGSMTAKTVTTTGSATVTGTLTAGGGNFVVDNSINRAVIDFNTVGIGTNTPSSSYLLQVTDTGDLGVVVGTSGSMTAKTLAVTGSATVTGTLTAAVGAGSSVGIGTTTPSASYRLQVTDDANLGFVVGNNGSITAKAITATGSATLTGPVLIGTNTPSLASALYVGSSTTGNLGTITAGFLSIGTITANVGLHGTTTVHFPGNILVTGTFNVVGNKQFLIPHPDPEKKGWLLRHCAVESPTRGDNLYRYKIVIPSDGGEASFSLPTYWAHLNEEPEVWVSAVGQFAQGYGYVDEVTNTLVVKGEKKGIYNVLLIGTRKDLYAREFDARGVEFVNYEMSELLTRGEKKDAVDVQLIDAHSDHVIKNFMDPIVDRFGLATHQ